jgi:DNA-binding transcriptional ArsR family regulator
MIDEGNVLIRGLSTSALKQLFQVIEQGRALGIYFVWATQFPKAENLPTEIRSQLNCKLCLLLLTSEEAHVVFKDDVALGWTPHRMIGPGWVLIKDADHRTPEESKARWLTEDNFESVWLSGQPVSGPSGQPVSGQPVSGPSGQPVSGPSGPDKIIGELMLSGVPLGVSELARRTGLAKSTVSEILRRMEREGVVCNQGTDVRPTYVLRLAEDPEL